MVAAVAVTCGEQRVYRGMRCWGRSCQAVRGLAPGTRLAGGRLVPLRWLIWTLLAACRTAPVGLYAREAPAVPCSSHRVGQVTVTGAPASAVPQLAVLAGTIDDPERTERVARVTADALRAQGY